MAFKETETGVKVFTIESSPDDRPKWLYFSHFIYFVWSGSILLPAFLAKVFLGRAFLLFQGMIVIVWL